MFLECSGRGSVLHSHTYYANTHLFKKFIERFIERMVVLESNSKGDFIEEWGLKWVYEETFSNLGSGFKTLFVAFKRVCQNTL